MMTLIPTSRTSRDAAWTSPRRSWRDVSKHLALGAWIAAAPTALVAQGAVVGGTAIQLHEASAVDPAADALDRLRDTSSEPVTLRAEDGRIVTLSAKVAVDPGEEDPVAQALDFLADYADLWQLDDVETDLYPHRIRTDEVGTHISFRRRYGDVPAFNGSLMVHIDNGAVYLVNGRLAPPMPELSGPSIDPIAAEALALEGLYGTDLQALGETLLGVFDLIGADGKRSGVLAYRTPVGGFDLDQQPAEWWVFVDAHSGAVLQALPQQATHNSAKYQVRYAENQEYTGCWYFNFDLWFDESGATSDYDANLDSPPDGTRAFDFSDEVYDFFHLDLGWHSYDDGGSEFVSMVHYGEDFDNAIARPYCGGLMLYGEGWATDDIVAHEFVHLITDATADLEYQWVSGALNESFSDVFGAMVDADDWLVGEDLDNGPIRDLSHPPANGDPDHILPSVSGDGVGLRTNPLGPDDGFVHTNSGIPNKVAFLVTDGGLHNGYLINGFGRTKTARLYHSVLTSSLTSGPSLNDARDAFVNRAAYFSLLNFHGFTDSDVCQIKNAWASVGIAVNTADSDCDGVPDVTDTDNDNDFAPDSTDNCPNVSNPTQSDQDGDGIGDACDLDIDGDGWNNPFDNCPEQSNFYQDDLDGDGIGDVCDDSDGDKIFDAFDNCPFTVNPNQYDRDADGVGNACDNDDDNDGIDDAFDNCPLVANPNQTDTDLDGVGDFCDNCPTNYNPNQQDCNGNGIGTACDAPIDELVCQEEEGFFTMHEFVNPLDEVTFPHIIPFEATYLPEGTELEVSIVTAEQLPMMIVDSYGRVVAQTTNESGQATMSFAPNLEYHYVTSPDGETRLPWETEYKLLFSPDWAGGEVELELEIQTVTP